MSTEHYTFALFIACLVSLVAILCRALFGSVKRRRRLYDEKEAKLMETFRLVESIMEEWNDQVKLSIDEMKELENRAARRLEKIMSRTLPLPDSAPIPPPPAEPIAIPATATPSKTKPAKPAEPIAESQTHSDPAPEKPTRTDTIVALAKDGKTIPQIARELAIAQNEVNLVIGLTANSNSYNS